MDDWDKAARLRRPSVAEVVFGWVQRLMALACLLFGLLYWTRLVGAEPNADWRFDLMPSYWQAASVALSVLYPFAAIGLWMLASWGPVVWFICASVEAVMHLGFADLFGEREPVLVAHACAALLYVGCRVAIFRQRRAAEVSAH
ncbi:MAG TPA: DUF6163 family protein [Mesorhizobium sp.]|jgi:hypothetical protein|nr:DUF6163 family protein [Mesorhizobium sp.]